MSKSFSGGCACGAIRYDIGAEPILMSDCQCRDCQRRSGTGHGSYVAFTGRQAVQLAGTAAQYDIVGDSGGVKTHAFCATCGTPVYLTFPAMPDLLIVHAASLDDPARYNPQLVTYRSSGHVWDQVDPTLPAFDKMPPN